MDACHSTSPLFHHPNTVTLGEQYLATKNEGEHEINSNLIQLWVKLINCFSSKLCFSEHE